MELLRTSILQEGGSNMSQYVFILKIKRVLFGASGCEYTPEELWNPSR
jgi:hypothetical protein